MLANCREVGWWDVYQTIYYMISLFFLHITMQWEMSCSLSMCLGMGVCSFLWAYLIFLSFINHQYLSITNIFAIYSFFFSKRLKKLCSLSWVTCVQVITLISSVSLTVCECGSRASWCPLCRTAYVMPRSSFSWSHQLEVPHLTFFFFSCYTMYYITITYIRIANIHILQTVCDMHIWVSSLLQND